jgi:hypothetical protein
MILLLPLAFAQDGVDAPPSPDHGSPSSPFHRTFSFGSYAAVRRGSYDSGGMGTKIRWEPTKNFGLDLYLEVAFPESEGGFRHDYPNGFSVYGAVPIGPVRIRPYLGFCDVLSFVEPTEPGAPRADDVLIGVHGGLGSEVALTRFLSLFVEGQVDVYAGHDRSSGGWTGDVAEDLIPFVTGQVNAGLQVHVADLF